MGIGREGSDCTPLIRMRCLIGKEGLARAAGSSTPCLFRDRREAEGPGRAGMQ